MSAEGQQSSETGPGNSAHHRIRLKGPWGARWLGAAEGTAPSGSAAGSAGPADQPEQAPERRVQMPASWREVFGDVAGRARFTRRFHCPTGLGPGDQVFVVLDGFDGCGTLRVDETTAGPLDSTAGRVAAIEITRLLSPACRLEVELELAEPPDDERPGGLWGAVYLEIREGSGGPPAG